MFDKYKRRSNGQFAPTGSRNRAPVNQDMMSGAPEWKRTRQLLSEVLPQGFPDTFIPLGRNRNNKSGLYDGLVSYNGRIFEVRTKKSSYAQHAYGMNVNHSIELWTTGLRRAQKITKPSEFRAVFS